MFSVDIKDEHVFYNFLASNDLDYVDVYLHDTIATLVMNTSDVFSVVTEPCTHTPNETSRGFRIPRDLLKQQKRATAFTVRFLEDGQVSVSFYNGTELLCSGTFIYQQVYSSAYADRLNLLRNKMVPAGIDLDTIAPLIKLCNTQGGLINIESSVVGAIFQSGVRVYQQLKYDGILCISPKSAQTLRKCDSKIFSIENYVGAYKDDFAILVNKMRVLSNSEFLSLEQARSQYRASVDFTNLVSFVSSHPMKIPNFIINLDEKCCTFMENEITYKIPITIRDEVRAPSDKFHELVLPFSIVRYVLSSLGSTTVQLEKKQFFTQMHLDTFTILFN